MADILDIHGQPLQSSGENESIPTLEDLLELVKNLQANLAQQQQQPKFPLTNVNIPPDGSGMKVSFILAPGVELSTTLGPDLMHQICKQWAQTVRNIQDQMRVIQHVNSTKLN